MKTSLSRCERLLTIQKCVALAKVGQAFGSCSILQVPPYPQRLQNTLSCRDRLGIIFTCLGRSGGALFLAI